MIRVSIYNFCIIIDLLNLKLYEDGAVAQINRIIKCDSISIAYIINYYTTPKIQT